MTFGDLASYLEGTVLINSAPQLVIRTLVTDSRKPFLPKGAIFYAIDGKFHNGHAYINELYEKGVRNFIVTQDISIPDGNVIRVQNAIAALQKMARKHREEFDLPIIGITGSNGKTIVKEWLSSCLAPVEKIVKSPKSYNSQLGVPLSVWNISAAHTLGIFEAGISTVQEMEQLAEVIQPTIGIFTNLGSAHDEGFKSRVEKFKEKIRLFESAKVVIHKLEDGQNYFGDKSFSWGYGSNANVQIISDEHAVGQTHLTLKLDREHIGLILPFDDRVSVENAMHCITYMLYRKMGTAYIQNALLNLQQLSMRLELKRASNNSYLIDDTYNNDLAGLQVAVNFLTLQKQRSRKVLILSDLLQTGMNPEDLYAEIATMIESAKIDYFIGVGEKLFKHQSAFKVPGVFFERTRDLVESLERLPLDNALLLIKGARSFYFEKVVQLLEEKVHETVLEINLDALTNNLNFYKSKLDEPVKIMVMVKAFAYGSGSFEVANLLQFHRVDYLGVAYADEGVQLRKNGIYLPIMVMNANEDSFESLSKYDLDPVIYDVSLLEKYITFLNGAQAKVHLELDTGMKRLGFGVEEIPKVIQLVKTHDNVEIASIFSHLAAADESEHEQFSRKQANAFTSLATQIKKGLNIESILHLVNSPGIIRYPEYHYDMVRLGVGLYGLEANSEQQDGLENISTLKTVISQIREVKAGESIGYGRAGMANNDMRIATIAIGYADGFTRSFSNGVGEVWVNGKRASVIGNVCMDMTMIDVTHSAAHVGDEVEIFGKNISIIELADKINTIPYEILTNVSQRVKRVYYTS